MKDYLDSLTADFFEGNGFHVESKAKETENPSLAADDLLPTQIKKRNIPGVTSDAYHLGYFEDKTDRYQIKRRVETELEPLIQSLYLFGILLLILTALAALVFVIREYTYTFRARKHQEIINENIADHYWSTAEETTASDKITLRQQSDIGFKPAKDKRQHWPRSTFSASLSNVDVTSRQRLSKYKESNQAEETASVSSWGNNNYITPPAPGLKNSFQEHDLATDTRELTNKGHPYYSNNGEGSRDTNYLEVLSISSNKESISTFCYYTGVKGNPVINNGKRVYHISELMALRRKFDDFPVSAKIQVEEINKDKKKKEADLKKMIHDPVIDLEPTKFYSAWKAGKAIKELSSYLTNDTIPPLTIHDTVTKKIMIIKLLAVGSNNKRLTNPNIYLSDFNTLMNRIVDTGIIFDLLNESKPVTARALINMFLRYIWCHWQYRTTNHRSIVSQFKAWKFSSPSIQPHHVLFRYLCNIELGIYAVGRMDLQALKDSENKILSLLNFFATSSFCNDYIGFVPIISQAVEFTDRVLSQRLFYNLLYIIVEKHKDCCMNDYLVEDKINFKPLIQHGFWIQNDSNVRKTAENIHSLIVEKYPQSMSYVLSITFDLKSPVLKEEVSNTNAYMYSWWKEIECGRVFVHASAKVLDTGEEDVAHSAVGSWLAFSPPPEKYFRNNVRLNKIQEESEAIREIENGKNYQPNVPGSYNF